MMREPPAGEQSPAPLPVRVVHVAAGRHRRGGERQALLLARNLQAWGQPQVVVTRERGALAGWLRAQALPVLGTAWDLSIDPRALVAVLRAVRGGPALLHAHDAHAYAVAAAAARLTGTPLVVTRRVDNPLRRPGLWRRADRVIAISARVAEVLRASGIAPDRIEIVHSGIDVAATRGVAPHPVREELGLPPGAPIAATVGALLGHKDHATMLRAAAVAARARADLHWVIAGEGPERPALEALRAALGLEGRVHLPGHVPWAVGLIAAADVFVFSSRDEGLGTSVLDAMALGIPVAATAGGGVPEMLAGDAGLLVPVGDADALGDATCRLLGDAALRRRVVAGAARRLEGFTDRAMARGTRAVYASVMRSSAT